MKNTTELLTSALAPTEAILRNEYTRLMAEKVDAMLTELKLDGWDAQKRYSYPSGSMGRNAYLAQKARYDLCGKYTNTAGGSYNPRGPRIVSPKAGYLEIIKEEAAAWAKAALASFTAKLAKKIEATGIEAREIRYDGGTNPWGFSHIHVLSQHSPTVQTWKTKMILNISCLGKPFNQWPTRQVI